MRAYRVAFVLALVMRFGLPLLVLAAVLASCGGTSRPPNPLLTTTAAAVETTQARPGGTPRTIRVPQDAATVQGALDSTQPGDLVLIAPGTYREAVTIRTPGIVVRGLDRNAVVFDGEDQKENGILVAADGVAVENLTIRRYAVNGLLFTKAYDDADPTQHTVLDGYRASYVTASNNGLYGIYAFFARGGQIDHAYVSGHPDSGIYIGQCKPCDAVVTDSVAERNAIGYEGTNASGNLWIVRSIWRNNRVGMTPNSQDQERLAPQGDVVIAGNVVADNNDPAAPATAQGASGFGIAVGGGNRNQVIRNRVHGNASAGIAVTDLNGYEPSGNVVSANVLVGNGTDLAYSTSSGTTPLAARTNCFSANTFATSLPSLIESVMACPGTNSTVVSGALPLQTAPPNVDYRKVALPPPQPDMADPAGAAPVAATGLRPTIDLAAVVLPAAGA